MPLWLRKFTLNRISKDLKSQNDALKKATNDQNSTSANMGDPLPEHMKKAFQDQSKKSSYTTQRAKK
jgi:hypothetical protein